mgnify:FL=1
MKTETCGRCEGKGQIAEYGHISNGVCFKCSGTGKVAAKKVSAKSAEKELQRLAKVQEMNRKYETAKSIYANNLPVPVNHPYAHIHAMEFAKRDGVWETL